MIYSFYTLVITIFIIINKTNQDDDECLYAIQRKKHCFKIPMNSLNESCCYLEMEMNKITTTACIRVQNNPDVIEKRIFQIKENEEHYTLDNFKIKCFSYFYNFSIFGLIILVLLII